METSLTGKALNFGFNEYGFESHVSNIPSNYSISYVINSINIHYAHKIFSFKIIYTKKNINLIKLFKKLNFISDYLIIHSTKKLQILIKLKYLKNLKIIKNFKLISKPSKNHYISLKALKLLNERTHNSVYLISTSQGIITHFQALRKKISGFVVGIFYN